MSDPKRDAERMERARAATPPELPIVGPGRDRVYLVTNPDRTRPATSTTSTDVPGMRGNRAPLLLPGGPKAARPEALAPHAPMYPLLPGAQPSRLLVHVQEGER